MKTNIYGVYMSLQEDREAAARAWFEDPSVDTVRFLIAHIGMGNGRFRLYHDNAHVVLEAGEIPRYDDCTEHEEIALTSWLRFAKKDAANADAVHARPARAVPPSPSPAWRGRDFTSKGESMSTMDDLRASLRAADIELAAAAKACVTPNPNPLRGCPIDRVHLVERVDAAVMARDAAENALLAALDVVPA